MASFLDELLALPMGSPKFLPYCVHSAEADTLTGYFRGDSYYSERLTDHLTVFWSDDEPKSIVGFRVKNVSGITSQLPNWVHADLGGHQLRILFDKVRDSESKPSDASLFEELAELAGNSELQKA